MKSQEVDPIALFHKYYALAKASEKVDPDAIALATADETRHPSCRILYFRRLIGTKFCFFTNYSSQKGQELAENPWASAVFLWHMIGLQVRVEGPVFKLDASESDEYFKQRPLESKLSAATSRQSQPLESYEKFLSEIESKRASLKGKELQRPPHWGGYGIEPARIEFWTQGEHRRHKRELYLKNGDTWSKELLYP